MAGIGQIATDWTKLIDQTFNAMLPKVKKVRTVYAEETVDPSLKTMEYQRLTQSYAEATGYSAFSASAQTLADGSAPKMDDFGNEDGTATQVTHGLGFRIDRKLLNSALPYQQNFVTRKSVELLNSIENNLNSSLVTGLVNNAGQTYTATGGTWATTGDPVQDINDALNSFKKRSGGLDANYALIHPDNMTSLKNDQRFQNNLYSPGSSVLDKGTLTPKPMGLDWIDDTAVTKGTFFLGVKGMGAKLLIAENYRVTETDERDGGKAYNAYFTWIDQYPLPYYIMYGTGI